ncbi:MAG TPA: thioredoxin family protein [Sediminibacterium sp.]|nr:thioredoxin family protein [Sediminibacterium sp.]
MLRLLFFLTCFICTDVGAQPEDTVRFSSGIVQGSKGDFQILLKAVIRKGWWLYADNPASEINGPIMSISAGKLLVKGKSSAIDKAVLMDDPVFGKAVRVYKDKADFIQQLSAVDSTISFISIHIESFASNGKIMLPIVQDIQLRIPGRANSETKKEIALSPGFDQPMAVCGDTPNQKKGWFAIFILGIGGGLLALLTPCVFPMVPLTVSYFTNKAKNRKEGIRNGLLYGLNILGIYLLASLPFHLLDNINPQLLNQIATNAWINIGFFLICLSFAFSLFGWYDISLPSFMVNLSGKRSGAFFMAFTLVLVSFSCTGPILGSLLVSSLSGGAWELTAGMAGFGFALALPFALFAMFPQWLARLPKSGGWLDTVKKSLAFIELALAFKFLSNADMVEHWGILKREVFIAVWALIAFGLAAYLFGLLDIRMISGFHADIWTYPPVSFQRALLGSGVVVFAVYLIMSIVQPEYAKLSLLSGFPPPKSYSIFVTDHSFAGELEPDVVNDYERAVALSRETGKPLLIDFTGWACVNCRKMEEQVWTKPEIKALIRSNYVLLSLYVDDREKLAGGGTLGQKWARFQVVYFKQATQPLYVQLSPDQQLINRPIGYTPDANEYGAWLECGIETMKKLRDGRRNQTGHYRTVVHKTIKTDEP